MVEQRTDQPIRYGNPLPDGPARPFLGLTYPGLGFGVVGIVFALLMITQAEFLAAGAVLLVTFLVLLLVGWRFGPPLAGTTLLSRWLDKRDLRVRAKSGAVVYGTGVWSGLPVDRLHALPGVLAGIQEHDGLDGFGAPFVMLEHPAANSSVAVLRSSPDGLSMTPQPDADMMVAKQGAWIQQLTTDSALQGAVTVIDSALSGSAAVKAHALARESPHAPAHARKILREATAEMPDRVSRLDGYTVLCWERDALGRTPSERLGKIAAKLPEQVDLMRQAGAGAVQLCTSDMLARAVRVAYTPYLAEEIEADFGAGRYTPGQVSESGPEVLSDARGRWVCHDGFMSASAVMTVPPRMHFTERFLGRVFAPDGGFLRKRVAIFYRPLSQAEATNRAEQMRKTANVKATATPGTVSAGLRQEQRYAAKTEEELAVGAGLVRFQVVVTVTVDATEKAVADGEARMKEMLGGVGISWRWIEHQAAAGFHLTLPLGVLPWRWSSPIQALEEKL